MSNDILESVSQRSYGVQTGKGTTQIDHVVVSKYGVFAIETKNYRGETGTVSQSKIIRDI